MSKKKPRKKPRSQPRRTPGQRALSPPPRQLIVGMTEASVLVKKKRWTDAMARLLPLAEAYPNRPEVLVELLNVAYELKDYQTYQEYGERLIVLDPDDSDLHQGLAGAYVANGFPWLALVAFRRLLERFPDHPRADDVRETVALLESGLEETRQEAGLDEAIALDVLALDDQARSKLQMGQLPAARSACQKLLGMRPDFVPALNNLSQIELGMGDRERALEIAEKVLEQEPHNFQALGNLAHFYLVTGNVDRANQVMEQLLPLQSENQDIWAKKGEALSYLGRDEDLLALVDAAEKAGYFKQQSANPLLHHYRAVAAARTGDERLARRAWKAALSASGGLTIAHDNLEDLNRPLGEREGAWALPMDNWLSTAVSRDFRQLLSLTDPSKVKSFERALRQLLRRYPELLFLVPILLARGDPIGRRLAVLAALFGAEPELHSALRAFVTGRAGSDQFRMDTANQAVKMGILQPGPITMWHNGKQMELHLLSFEIHYEPMGRLPASIDDLFHEGYRAFLSGKLAQAEKLFLQALELEPATPNVINNLALVYLQQKRQAEADVLIARMVAEFPDYFFGILAQANLKVDRGDFQQAQDLLDGLVTRPKLHISEFRGLCMAYMQLLLKRGEPGGARVWLSMWEQTEPDNPEIEGWRLRISRGQESGDRKSRFGSR
ncbi:MAG: tetratricopeptide repeat protein [Caldilineaceae bacterium]|nr:tetratricopeptide repeat protein [Caldilineaceae bacterium]